MCRTISGGSSGRASHSQDSNPAVKMGADVGATLDYPPAEDSDDVSVTNSEVESAMNHRRRRAVLRDPSFSEESFNAFNSADAYIRAARDGLNRATKQHLKDVQVSLLCLNMITYEIGRAHV